MINKIKNYIFTKIVRLQFERLLKKTTKQIEKGSMVLDFASASNKYSHNCKHTIYYGADIDVPKEINLENNQFFINADLNNNPFKREVFDTVICTNCIDYVSDDLIKIKKVFDNLLNNLHGNGTFITFHNNEWAYWKDYQKWIYENFENVKCYTYSGAINSKINNITLNITKIKNLRIRKNISIIFSLIIFSLRGALNIIDKILYSSHSCFFYVAKKKKNNLIFKKNNINNYFDVLNSPKNGRDLFKIEKKTIKLEILKLIESKYKCEINYFLSDKEYIFPVIDGIPRLLTRDAFKYPD
jgi:uncharacterized protein YbaR (Trm112 family)